MSTPAVVDFAPGSPVQRKLCSVLQFPATYFLFGSSILLLDWLTSQFLLPFMLYVIPVALAAWFARGRTSYALSILLPVGSLALVLFLEHSAPPHYAIFNSLIQIGVLLFLAVAGGVIRQNIELKRELTLLHSILPVCMGCKRIRDERQNWQVLEVYVTEHTDSVVSHGVCPECAKSLYGVDFTPQE